MAANNATLPPTKDRLLFVYNADSGLLNMLIHWTHKIVSPSTYNCQLCALTYSNSGMRKEWHTFITSLPLDTDFFHRDEFIKQYPNLKDTPLPCIFIEKKTNPPAIRVLLDAQTLNKQQTLDQLMQTCTQSIQARA
jgi:S-adenosylmethionine:diacylglycerol 3-amino-3-carboxypropyl transferase